MTASTLTTRYYAKRVAAALLALPLLTASFVPALATADTAQNTRQQYFAAAAQEFGVPESVLLAVSYNESRWESHPGASMDGGYGLMDLRTYAPTLTSGRDGSQVTPVRQAASFYTLDQAAALLHLSPNALKTDDRQNIRGAAAVLAQDARQLGGGKLPTSTGDWYAAVAKFSGSSDSTLASSFADDVFATVKAGTSLTTTDSQAVSLPSQATVQPNRSMLSALGLKNSPAKTNLPGQNAECPPTLNCRFIPAAYAQDDPNDPTNYGNWDPSHRPADMQIKYIVIHDMEGYYDGSISWFQNPASYSSAHYLIRSSDGAITQMVPNSGVSWGAGDWYVNMHAINIEHEGFAANGATWYTEAMYKSSATLVRWLAAKYHIPLDRAHIIGHENIPTPRASVLAAQHWDPAAFWDWDHYMDLIRGVAPTQSHIDNSSIPSSPITPPGAPLKKGDVLTIAPNFATNQPPVTDCQTGTCQTLPKQGASFVYLHTQPSASAPLLSDPYLHPDGSAGTTRDDDTGDKAPSGSQYVVADVQNDWTAIWYGGQIGWFYNPPKVGQTAHRSWSRTITPRPGVASVPVYGVAYPEDAAYPPTIPVKAFDTLYNLPAGQHYVLSDSKVPTDYFYDATVNYSLPDDHMIVRGQQKYYQISLNHRIGYVKSTDVVAQ